MLADDTFRSELAVLINKLTSWAEAQREAGAVDIRSGNGFWSVSTRPATQGACPIALVLRSDQKFDLAIGPERIEDRQINDFGFFPKLVKAVSEGLVERKVHTCALTGAKLSHELRVLLGGGEVWSEGQRSSSPVLGERVLEETRRYLPYVR